MYRDLVSEKYKKFFQSDFFFFCFLGFLTQVAHLLTTNATSSMNKASSLVYSFVINRYHPLLPNVSRGAVEKRNMFSFTSFIWCILQFSKLRLGPSSTTDYLL